MTRLTFGISASFFTANMAIKWNAIRSANDYRLAAHVVDEQVYVDDLLTGAAFINEAIEL